MTRVTVITAVLNGAATIDATLESVAGQTARADLEHVVVDGGSTDDTLARVARATHRPRVVTGPDAGVYDAFNKGLAAARGEWVAFLGADDAYAHPRVVETVLQAAADHPDADVLHGDADWVDARGRVVREGRFVHRHPPGTPAARADYAQFPRTMPVFHPATFCRARLFERIGGFDASYRIAGDYDLLLRAWLTGAAFRHVPDVLVRLRTGGLSERKLAAELEVARVRRRRSGAGWLPAAASVGRVALVALLEERAPGVLAAVRSVKRRIAPLPAPWGCVIRAV